MDNQDQIEFWDGDAGSKWSDYQTQMDAMLGPLGLAGIDILAPANGARVLDVGCGCGDTSLVLAERGTQVTGVDVSGPMLARARDRAATRGLDVSFRQADASSAVFDAPFDHVFSRFGVMFFADPTRAFAHIRSQLAPNGSVTFVCWRAAQENPWISEPTAAVFKHVPRPDEAPDPLAPGPFAFAGKVRVSGILQDAGFANVEVAPLDLDLTVGRTVDEAMLFVSEIGPASRLLVGQTPDVVARVKDELTTLMGDRMGDGGIRMAAACWIVSAS
ncbi:MAG: SAM-dependent methyltransferase [Gammaproteobacteria bacterium]|nr:SAM-dependent methyltransferase [Gammaproteobacteria bacterium]